MPFTGCSRLLPPGSASRGPKGLMTGRTKEPVVALNADVRSRFAAPFSRHAVRDLAGSREPTLVAPMSSIRETGTMSCPLVTAFAVHDEVPAVFWYQVLAVRRPLGITTAAETASASRLEVAGIV